MTIITQAGGKKLTEEEGSANTPKSAGSSVFTVRMDDVNYVDAVVNVMVDNSEAVDGFIHGVSYERNVVGFTVYVAGATTITPTVSAWGR